MTRDADSLCTNSKVISNMFQFENSFSPSIRNLHSDDDVVSSRWNG